MAVTLQGLRALGRPALVAISIFGLAVAAGAQTARYPDHPVKVVVGFSAGGGTDVAARVIAQKLVGDHGADLRGREPAPARAG